MNRLQILRNVHKNLLNNSFHNYTPRFNILDSTEIEKVCHELKVKKQPAKAYLKEFIFLCVQGTKDVWYDTKWLMSLRKQKQPHFYSALETKRSDIIAFDLLKFVPFSFFIFVPFAEVLLPPYLILFPNSIPTQYMFDHQWIKQVKTQEEKQEAAQKDLVQLLNGYLIKKGVQSSDLSANPAQYNQTYLKHIEDVDRHLTLENLNSDQLIQVLQFLAVDFIQGTYMLKTLTNLTINLPMYIANLVLWAAQQQKRFKTFDFDFKLNFWKFEDLKKQLLIFQIYRQLNILRKQDLQFQKIGFNDINSKNITDFIRERGLTNYKSFEEQKVALNKMWMEHSLQWVNSNNKLFWLSIANYESTKLPTNKQ